MHRTILAREALLMGACFFCALFTSPAFAFLLHPFASRLARHGLMVAEATKTKDGLIELLEQAPNNNPTSQRLTADILTTVRLMEKECPTPDAEVVQALAGKSTRCLFCISARP